MGLHVPGKQRKAEFLYPVRKGAETIRPLRGRPLCKYTNNRSASCEALGFDSIDIYGESSYHMNMKNNITAFLLLMILMTALPVSADLIWTEDTNGLFDDCKNIGMMGVIAAGEKGWIESMFPFPDSGRAGIYANGTEFIVDRICGSDGREWYNAVLVRYPQPGSPDYTGDAAGERIPADDVVRAYDGGVFLEDHAGEIREHNETFDLCGLVPFTVWQYPDSPGRLFDCLTEDVCRIGAESGTLVPAGRRYLDADGDRWELLATSDPYHKFGWIDLDHPGSGEAPSGAFADPEPLK